METVRVSSKGQIVIPKSMRETHRIRSGMTLVVTSVGDELRFKVAAGKSSTLDAVAGMLRRHGAKRLTDERLKRIIAKRIRNDDLITKRR
jgi:AbrB family looped-hinge helix DNA binding protein